MCRANSARSAGMPKSVLALVGRNATALQSACSFSTAIRSMLASPPSSFVPTSTLMIGRPLRWHSSRAFHSRTSSNALLPRVGSISISASSVSWMKS